MCLSLKIRFLFQKKHLPDTGKSLFADPLNVRKSEIGPILEKIAKEIESKDGRQAVIVKVDR